VCIYAPPFMVLLLYSTGRTTHPAELVNDTPRARSAGPIYRYLNSIDRYVNICIQGPAAPGPLYPHTYFPSRSLFFVGWQKICLFALYFESSALKVSTPQICSVSLTLSIYVYTHAHTHHTRTPSPTPTPTFTHTHTRTHPG